MLMTIFYYRKFYLNDEDRKNEETIVEEAQKKLENETFNQKAHELIERSCDTEMLLNADLNYASWF